MPGLEEQLALLRRKIARIDRKYAPDAVPPARRPPAPPPLAEPWLPGEPVETPLGTHCETERLYERHRRHGSMDISNLIELPEDLLGALALPPCPVARWAFLDTETTGLAGGSGTYAFLIGIGRVAPDGFRVRQFFMRDYGEEPSLLWSLARHLEQFDVLVTYNGKTYDQPLLETRYRMTRSHPPFDRMAHLDLLHGARRLWKLRLETCRLIDLETQILGVEREGDLPGEMIPYVYFEYLRTQQAFRVLPVFHHNAVDILTTACLTAIVPYAFRDPHSLLLRHGADLVGLARWFLKEGEQEKSLQLLRRAVDLGMPDHLMFRTLWDIAALEKKLGNGAAALEVLGDLAESRNPFRAQALEELAKHYEHAEKNCAMALEMIRTARTLSDCGEFAKREARLERRLARQQRRLL